MSGATELCDHLIAGTWPLRVDLVLDDHLGMTDGLASCRDCGAVYLLEMLDWRGRERVMRMARLEPAHAARLIHDLERGSCDHNRASAELQHARSQATRLPWLLRLDGGGPTILGLAALPDAMRPPGAGWRELPCDGHWVDYARSNTEMVKE